MKLVVWQRGRALTVAVTETTRPWSDRSAPGLRSQLLRATMSISSNVVEGASRETRADFARFIAIAIGSSSEVEHHLTVCVDLGMMDRAIASALISQTTEVRRMLFGLRRALIMRPRD